MLEIRNSKLDLQAGSAGRSVLWFLRLPFPDLLAPHGVVQALQLDQLLMPSRLHNPTAFQNVDPVRMQNGRETVRNEDRDEVFPHRKITNGFADLLFRQGIQ